MHKCGLLHEATQIDPRPTRIFSDSDCRTHALHLRGDSGEDILTLCKQLGWKVPAPIADTGSSVYRRCDAVVTGSEYNTMFISFLQLQYEGHIAAKAGINSASVIESARMNWKQWTKINSTMARSYLDGKLELFVRQKILEQRMGRVESRLERIENTLTEIKEKEVFDTTAIAKEITTSVIESLRSAIDVGQLVVSKIKKKKLRRPQNKVTSAEEESAPKNKKFKHEHKTAE